MTGFGKGQGVNPCMHWHEQVSAGLGEYSDLKQYKLGRRILDVAFPPSTLKTRGNPEVNVFPIKKTKKQLVCYMTMTTL